MIIVMGLPGAGKTTVLEKVKTEKKNWTFLNWGDLMFDVERETGWVKQRDEMRKLPVEKQLKAQEMAAKKLSEMANNRIVIDTHCSILTPTGYLPGLPFRILKMIPVTHLVLVTADVKEVEQRRKNDPTRVRDTDDIGLHDQMNKAYLASYSAFTGANAVIIYNNTGKLDDAVKKLAGILA